MRWMVDAILVLLLVGMIIGLTLSRRQAHSQRKEERLVQNALARMHEQVPYRGALNAEPEAGPTERYPSVMRPKWFETPLPVNTLVDSSRPWLDIAPAEDRHRHPPDPVCISNDQAGFWYNPSRGIIRARVERQSSKANTLALYNRVNQTDMQAMPASTNQPIPENRQPISFGPTRRPALPNALRTTPNLAHHPPNVRNPFSLTRRPAPATNPARARAQTEDQDKSKQAEATPISRPTLRTHD